ncbi:MAG TPA: MarR family transcriptional regulator [Candidatus Dormibacteraeota bacterium]|nr:MarR family transcriptional regulator [Candidatus Dormibacteraeota bacterium]
MQVPGPGIVELVDQLIAESAPGRRGIDAWLALLRAHATLVRQLALDLVEQTGLTLGDYDVLSQLAFAGGALRMTELADRAYSSRSGMTRRVDRLVEQGLVSRTETDADGRGVVVTLTEKGVSRFKETAPIHIRGVAELFGAPLDDQELAVVERAMKKVTLKSTFG